MFESEALRALVPHPEAAYPVNGEVSTIVACTQAEYDALPSSKLTDGVVYLIEEA